MLIMNVLAAWTRMVVRVSLQFMHGHTEFVHIQGFVGMERIWRSRWEERQHFLDVLENGAGAV